MTKLVRIENADMSNFRVAVDVIDLVTVDGETKEVVTKTVELNYPTAMTDSGIYLTSTRKLVVRELEPAKS